MRAAIQIIAGVLLLLSVMMGIILLSPKATEAQAQPQYLPGYTFAGKLNDTTWLYHDEVRGITCYLYSFTDTSHSPTTAQGGLSCVPDSQLKGGHFQ